MKNNFRNFSGICQNLLVSYQLRPNRAYIMVDSVIKLDTVFSRNENSGNKAQKSDKKCIRAMGNLWEIG